MRLLLVWLVLFGLNCAAIGAHPATAGRFDTDEAHQLLAARSVVKDRDVDVANQYLQGDDRRFAPRGLLPSAQRSDGALNEPVGVGFPALVAPAYAAGGTDAVELLLAAIAALAFTLAIPLARRTGVPDPWATWAPLLVAASPPALAWGSTVAPQLAAGALLAGAALAALRARERPTLRAAVVCGALLSPLPWLGVEYVAPGAIVLAALGHWLVRRHRGVWGLIASEIVFVSLVVFVTVNGRFYGGLTPEAAASGPGTFGAPDPGRAERVVSLLVDRDVGLLRWAPVLALAALTVFGLWRSLHDHLGRAVPEHVDEERATGLLALVVVAQALVAVLAVRTLSDGGFPGTHLVAVLPLLAALCAPGLRGHPRLGAALGVVTVGTSAWLLTAGRAGPWRTSDAPLGPLLGALPRFDGPGPWPAITLALAACAFAALVVLELRRSRRFAAGRG